ncbi:endonuclease/exonuclease/phosphatase family protein [Mucilaginibacter jinjuensis]|uniref:Endonuclease/exonuclease/phosphatase family protein n=1 Tax=Mucilaginibacter jinjuensis TaxID=1176721 RepID=A0ABY7T621_9SPHI|nr:endonuclease/exonuclease/phosphatase family protein [Mucilaginibacter jinjuensis]WCT11821.1 endonuclease/exonuclease/phosphatase family protein [Mucilaginibacter jinjuensis]
MKAKKRLGFITKLLVGINVGFALALLISYLAPVTDPANIWLVAFFGLAYPPLLLINVLIIIFWMFKRSWFAFISLLSILAGYRVMQNSFGFNSARTYTRKESPDAIRIMTYNVHSFKKYGSKNDIWTKHEILDIIREHQPDILGFQEYYTRKKGEYDMTDSIKSILNKANLYFEAVNYDNSRDAQGVAVFSKYPIINKGFIQISEKGNGNQCIFIDVKNKEQIFRYYCVHLRSIGFEKEDYQYLDSVSKKGKTDMHSFRRIGSKLKQAFIARSKQVHLIKEQIKQCPYPYIIAGDFNDTPSSYAVHEMSTGLKNAFREKGNGLGRTYNGDFPNYQIDYILTSPRFNVEDYRVIEKRLSDHYPVYSDLVLK